MATDLLEEEHSSPLTPGEILGGKYRIGALLGMGGMGVVYEAHHLQLDQRCAIKLLIPELVGSEEVVQRFLREARAIAQIRSEHVVRAIDVDTLPSGVPYIVMEFLEGANTEELLATRGAMPQEMAVDLLLQACEALAEAHAIGIVHRDLKPANLFLTARADGTPIIKVLDFGISKGVPRSDGAPSNLTREQTIMGTPSYMSPEQLRSTHTVDARSDIWSLGVILHEWLTGVTPFGGTTAPDICANVLKEPPQPLRELLPEAPPELEALVQRCLEKEADLRFQNIAAFAFALAPFGSNLASDSAERIVRLLQPADLEEVEEEHSAVRFVSHIPTVSTSPSAPPVATSYRVEEKHHRIGIATLLTATLLLGMAGGGILVGANASQSPERVERVEVERVAPAEVAEAPRPLPIAEPPRPIAEVDSGGPLTTEPEPSLRKPSPKHRTPAPARPRAEDLFNDRK